MSKRHARMLRQIRPKRGYRPASSPYSHDWLEFTIGARTKFPPFDREAWEAAIAKQAAKLGLRLVKAGQGVSEPSGV